MRSGGSERRPDYPRGGGRWHEHQRRNALTVTSIADRNDPWLSQKSNFFQAVFHVNSFSSNNLPALPICRLNSVHVNSRVTAPANASAPSANRAFSPSRTGSPSAPMVVETTGNPAAQASRIFKRVPLPVSNGTTATRERGSSQAASTTGPAPSIPGSPVVNRRTAVAFFPSRRQSRFGHWSRKRGQISRRKKRTAVTFG